MSKNQSSGLLPDVPDNSYNDLNLDLSKQFDLERMTRIIDNCESEEALRKVAKQLLRAWFVQKAAIDFAIRSKLANPLNGK